MTAEQQADRAQLGREVSRMRRQAATVIAQYIRDLTRPPGPGPLAPA